MELEKKQESIENLLSATLAKAQEDEFFKQKLLKSPIETIEQLTGEKLVLKKGFKMVVVDQSAPNTFYFNITKNPILEDVELSEKQLELVAGGDWDSAIRTYEETDSVWQAAHSFFFE